MDFSPYKSDFVTINDIHLHYLDWGGNGPSLIFLGGLGETPYIFGRFAPRFTDQFHVIGLSRRGHGDSDYPETGYDADTLTEDLHQFLDAVIFSKGEQKVILAGHSMAYIEMTHFAMLYPERVSKLIFIETHDLNSEERKAIQSRNPLRDLTPPWPEKNPSTFEDFAALLTRTSPMLAAVWGAELDINMRHSLKFAPDGVLADRGSETIDAAIHQTLNTYKPHYESIQIPMLRIFAMADGTNFLSYDFMTEEQRAQGLAFWQNELNPYYERYIAQFRQSVPHAQVVVIPHSHHMCFISHPEETYQAMRKFLGA